MGVRIRGRELQVDIEAELRQYNWYRAKWLADKLIACSPFRDEKTPSFACSLEEGIWVDSGSLSDDWKKGNFPKLLAFLRNESYEEAEEYLIETYAPENWDVETLKINMKLELGKKEKPFPSPDLLKPFAYVHPYLNNRGLTDKTQAAVQIGYDPATRSVVIPWFDYKGRLISWKHRSVQDKRFWYYAEGQRIKNHLYGLNLVYRLKRFEEVFIVESEIDALTLWQNGRAAVAMGGASLTKEQKKLILQAGIKRLVLATDNDGAGQKAKESIIQKLAGYVELAELQFPAGRKDINDFTEAELKNLNVKPVKYGFLK